MPRPIVKLNELELQPLPPEIAEYPDSGKYGALANYGVNANGQPNIFRVVGCLGESADYWEEE